MPRLSVRGLAMDGLIGESQERPLPSYYRRCTYTSDIDKPDGGMPPNA